jgi:hypothetical protein
MEEKKVEKVFIPMHEEVTGNIFEFWNSDTPVIVPINLNLNKFGHNVMNKGIAKDAKELFPILPNMIGKSIKQRKHKIDVFAYVLETNKVIEGKKEEAIILAFPTRFNYWEKADLKLIEVCARLLVLKVDTIYKKIKFDKIMVPKLGCGEGGLDWELEVKPLLEKILDERFILVKYDPESLEDSYSI